MQFRVIVVTDPQTLKQTGAITIHCAVASLALSVRMKYTINQENHKHKHSLAVWRRSPRRG